MSTHYKEAGVDIEAGDQFVRRIANAARSTHGPQVLNNIGGFAAHFALEAKAMQEPVLVSSTDGVGTKLRVAIETHRYDTIGTDLVGMCANDLACSGATPLFFLDYFATGQLSPEKHAPVVEGIARACRTINCALIGGETAEMPSMYQADDFDLAGFVVGIADRKALVDGSTVQPGQVAIGVASTGFHSNGYSLIRRVVQDKGLSYSAQFPGTDRTVADILMEPTALYSPLVRALQQQWTLHAMAHITGGGLTNNIPRVLPDDCAVSINWSTWELPAPFAFIQHATDMRPDELRTVLNCGVGYVIIADADDAPKICEASRTHGFPARVIGSVVARTDKDPAIDYV